MRRSQITAFTKTEALSDAICDQIRLCHPCAVLMPITEQQNHKHVAMTQHKALKH